MFRTIISYGHIAASATCLDMERPPADSLINCFDIFITVNAVFEHLKSIIDFCELLISDRKILIEFIKAFSFESMSELVLDLI